jgi:DNA-binding transcriptional regulator YdaS (Cro superfamily)
MDSWSAYVRRLTGDEPQDQVGRKVGLNGSTINRWRNGSRPGKPGEVAALAVAYGGNVLEAFVAAGFLTPEQAGVPPKARPDWTAVSNEELLEQVAARLVPDGAAATAEEEQAVSAPGGRSSIAVAAHEDASITKEQETRSEP